MRENAPANAPTPAVERTGVSSGPWPFAVATRGAGRVYACGLLPEVPEETSFPYHTDPLRTQSEGLLQKLKRTLKAAGVSPSEVALLDQWFAGPEDWPEGNGWSGLGISPYMEARSRVFPGGSPASVAVAVRGLPTDARVSLDALAYPGEKPMLLVPGEEGRPAFPAAAVVGGWVHLSGELPTDWRGAGGSAVAEEARTDPDLWYGNPARSQADLVLRRLDGYARMAGTDLSRAVHATVFLADRRDLAGFEEAWEAWFPEGSTAPARTVVPGAGFACRGCRVEVAMDLVLPGHPDPEFVFPEGLASPPGRESPAVRAGELLYVSGQMAVDEVGADPRGPGDSLAQPDLVLERLAGICDAAGTDLSNLLKVRLFFSDLTDSRDARRACAAAFGRSPPAGVVLGVGDLPVPGCRMMLDAVAVVPGGDAWK